MKRDPMPLNKGEDWRTTRSPFFNANNPRVSTGVLARGQNPRCANLRKVFYTGINLIHVR